MINLEIVEFRVHYAWGYCLARACYEDAMDRARQIRDISSRMKIRLERKISLDFEDAVEKYC